MFDTLVKVGSTLDWITPTLAFIQDICNGPAVHVACPCGQGWSANQIAEMLKQAGVKVWGLMVAGDHITFSVREAQARYALYWLERHGLAYESSLQASAPRRQSKADRQVTGQRKPARGIDGLLDGIAGFVDGL